MGTVHLYYKHPAAYGARKKSKWWALVFVLSFLLLVTVGYVYFAMNSEIPLGEVNFNNELIAPVESLEIAWPEEGQAAIGTLSDGVLARSDNEEQPRPIASLTKVITALAVLEKAPMQPGETGMVLTFDVEDEESYRNYVSKYGTVTNVVAGEQINQYQALQSMLLPSSNNISDSLVRRVFGSMEEYKTYANQMLQRFGLAKTHVDDASGFSPLTVSTPSEMIVVGQKALSHPIIAEIVAQTEAEIPLSGVVPNYNGLLKVEGVTGIKPGVTDEAGWCLLFSAKQQTGVNTEVSFIGVLLGEDDPNELLVASENLLTLAKTNLRQVEVVSKDESIGTYSTPWGETVELITQEELTTSSITGSAPTPVYKPTDSTPFPLSDQALGSVHLEHDPSKSVKVVTKSKITEPSLLWRLKRPLVRLGII